MSLGGSHGEGQERSGESHVRGQSSRRVPLDARSTYSYAPFACPGPFAMPVGVNLGAAREVPEFDPPARHSE